MTHWAILDGWLNAVGWTLLLLALRTLPLVVLLPVFGGLKASPSVRAGALFVLMLGMWPGGLVVPSAPLAACVSQLLFGTIAATSALLFFEAARMVGGFADVSLGRGSFGGADPLGSAGGGPLSTFYALLFVAVFVSTGSHVVLLRALAFSVARFPLDGVLSYDAFGAMVDGLITTSGAAIAVAVALVLPALGVGLIVDITLGWLNRTMPKLPVLFLAMPLRMWVGWLVLAGGLAVSIPALVHAATEAFAATVSAP